jgi:flagellar biogenesis protein FliO
MVFALAVVVLSIFVVLRWVSSKMQTIQGMQGRLLSVTSRVALEPKKGLWIVEAAGSYYLLATHDQGVTVLDKLDTPSVRAVLEGDEPPAQPFWKAFATKSDKTSTEAALSTAAIPTSFEIISDGKSTSSPTDTENNDAQDSSNS